ncbi:MAG: N-acetylmuramoyl-L-alanine amidase [bacterium]|nr:N-acetylmuramoyl-L-alanine amidase [bacterium]
MKKIWYGSVFLLGSALFVFMLFQKEPVVLEPAVDTRPLVVLDAGHGGEDFGATYPPEQEGRALLFEKDLNLAVVYAVKERLESMGVGVALTRLCNENARETSVRIAIAQERCKEKFGTLCDLLVSVHHNGSQNIAHDGLMVIYGGEEDIPLSLAVHEALWEGEGPQPLIARADVAELLHYRYGNEGFLTGEYGIVQGFSPAVLTEAYYITNKAQAQEHLSSGDSSSFVFCTGTEQQHTSRGAFSMGKIAWEADLIVQGVLAFLEERP